MRNVPSLSVSFDAWSSIGKDGYIALTAHFIDDNFKLNVFAFSVIHTEESHTSDNIEQLLKKELEPFLPQLVSVTHDNAYNVVSAAQKMKILSVRCSAHVLNLVLNDSLKPLKNFIQLFRDIV